MVFVNIDPGSSCIKASLKQHASATIHSVKIDSWGVVGQFDGVTQHGLNYVSQPTEFAGMYGTRTIESGAELDRDADVYSKTKFKMFLFATLAELLDAANLPADVMIDWLAIDFPATHTGRGEEVAQFLTSGVWPIQKADGMLRMVTIQHVICASQPFMAAIDALFTWKGNGLEYNAEKLASGAMLMVVPGSNSVEFFYLPANFKLAKDTCIMRGVLNLIDDLRRMAYLKIHKNLNDQELLSIFKEKRLTKDRVDYDFSQEVSALVEEWAAMLQGKLNTWLEQFPAQPATLGLAGGGAYHLFTHFAEAYAKQFVTIFQAADDHGNIEMTDSVNRGGLKYAVIQHQKSLNK